MQTKLSHHLLFHIDLDLDIDVSIACQAAYWYSQSLHTLPSFDVTQLPSSDPFSSWITDFWTSSSFIIFYEPDFAIRCEHLLYFGAIHLFHCLLPDRCLTQLDIYQAFGQPAEPVLLILSAKLPFAPRLAITDASWLCLRIYLWRVVSLLHR